MGSAPYGEQMFQKSGDILSSERHSRTMMFDIITIFLVGHTAVICYLHGHQFRGKFPKRSIDDVTPFLRPSEQDELESLPRSCPRSNFRCECHSGSLRNAAQANPSDARVPAGACHIIPGADRMGQHGGD